MRVSFDTIFIRNSDGSIEPRQRIRVGGVTFGPGVRFGRGVSFGGVDFFQFLGQDFEIDTDGDIAVIKGIYPPSGQ